MGNINVKQWIKSSKSFKIYFACKNLLILKNYEVIFLNSLSGNWTLLISTLTLSRLMLSKSIEELFFVIVLFWFIKETNIPWGLWIVEERAIPYQLQHLAFAFLAGWLLYTLKAVQDRWNGASFANRVSRLAIVPQLGSTWGTIRKNFVTANCPSATALAFWMSPPPSFLIPSLSHA